MIMSIVPQIDYRSNLLRYWRNSLADVERKKVSPSQTIGLGQMELWEGVVPSSALVELNEQWRRANGKQGKPNDTIKDTPSAIAVLVAPLVLYAVIEHGKFWKQGDPIVYPLWIPATLSSEGKLSPASERLPWIVRELLEPNQFSDITLGTVDDVDTFLTLESSGTLPATWSDTLGYAERMWTHVTDTSLAAYALPGFVRQEAVICLDAEPRNIAEGLLSLYNRIEIGLDIPLLDKLTARLLSKPELSNISLDQASEQHVGHISAQSLTLSQRLGLHATLALSGTNEFLAINGPPGTGKTTLLQSIIASLWVDAAAQGGEPPVILVASTNNRAVENVLESFGRAGAISNNHPLATLSIIKRWLPDVEGYGLYLKSRSVETDAQNTTREKTSKGPRWTGFVEMTEEPAYLKRASRHFLQVFQEYNGASSATLNEATDELHRQLRSAANALKRLMKSERNFRQLAITFQMALAASRINKQPENTASEETSLSLADIMALAQELSRHVEYARERRNAARRVRDEVAKVAAPKGLFEVLFKFIPAVRMQPWIRARALLEENRFHKLLDQYKSRPPTYAELADQLGQYVSQQEARLSEAERRHTKLLEAETDWRAQANVIIAKYQDSGSGEDYLSDFNHFAGFLDTHLRVELFHLAGRYWEGRWLLEMEGSKLALDQQNRQSCEARFRRFAKLTPCMVATPFMAAKYFEYFDGKSNPLTNFLDLLIVDEAGQVRPDIGVPIFALAKRAVVVGDTHQIEPVWEQLPPVDLGNLHKMGLDRFINVLSDSGSRVSSGNLMRMARHVSGYNQTNDRGIFLAEHFRCLEKIIDYCNRLTYGGRLVPSRMDSGPELLPAMGFAHIDSPSERQAKSWANPGEAGTIAEWLSTHKTELLATYPKLETLGEIIAIIAPFRAQVTVLKDALARVSLHDDGIVVGTVHAMQGGEKPVIIFSPTLSPRPSGAYFFDRGPNMLNVAVSRAKDSFLVFGNAGLFDAREEKPSGLLAEWLFADPDNEITDLKPALHFPTRAQDQIESIESLTGHRQILAAALQQAREKLMIVSPYISIRALEADDLLPAFASALERGVNIKVLVGSDMDREENGTKRENAAQAIQALKDCGVEITEIPRIHHKTLVVDELWLVEGSFNWLSAVRDETSKYQRTERSLMLKGPNAAEHIRKIWENAEHLLASDQ